MEKGVSAIFGRIDLSVQKYVYVGTGYLLWIYANSVVQPVCARRHIFYSEKNLIECVGTYTYNHLHAIVE